MKNLRWKSTLIVFLVISLTLVTLAACSLFTNEKEDIEASSRGIPWGSELKDLPTPNSSFQRGQNVQRLFERTKISISGKQLSIKSPIAFLTANAVSPRQWIREGKALIPWKNIFEDAWVNPESFQPHGNASGPKGRWSYPYKGIT